jgi:hypothetical protein
MATVESFRQSGDTDDACIARALASDAQVLEYQPGRVYTIRSGVINRAPGRTFLGFDARLVAADAARKLFTSQAPGCQVVGGLYAALPDYRDPYGEWAIGLHGDGSRVERAWATGGGTAIKVSGDASNARVSDVDVATAGMYGIYVETTSRDATDNRITDVRVDMRKAGIAGQGILMTGSGARRQLYFEISGARVRGPVVPEQADRAINIGVRGHYGRVTDCTTWGGAMGFSEGGDLLVLSDFQAFDLVGRCRWGFEISGRNATLTGVTATNAAIGVSCSFQNTDDLKVIGGDFQCDADGSGIRLQPPPGGSSRRATISATTIRARRGLLGTRDVSGAQLVGVQMIGTHPDSLCIALDTPPGLADVSLRSSTLTDIQKLGSVYSASPLTVSGLRASGNTLIRSQGAWRFSGGARAGANVVGEY